MSYKKTLRVRKIEHKEVESETGNIDMYVMVLQGNETPHKIAFTSPEPLDEFSVGEVIDVSFERIQTKLGENLPKK